MSKQYSYSIPIEHNLPKGPLWEYKHNIDEIEILRKSDSFVADAQYFQDPSPAGGTIFKTDNWNFFNKWPLFKYKIITADTAQKKGELNDFSVLQCWGKAERGIYLVDAARGRWEAPELTKQTRAFFVKHLNTQGGCRGVYIEDKVSGTGLIQTFRNAADLQKDNKIFIPVWGIPRNKDKATRAYDVVGYVESGFVYLLEDSEWLFDYIEEHRKFNQAMTHKHDDQVDCTIDAINIMLIKDSVIDDEISTAYGIGATQNEEII